MRANIILIGFMGTGKSVIGRLLARDLGLEFVDTDALIEKLEGRSIARIFRDSGEAHFRKVEREVIRTLEGRHGCVVATGGGVVLDAGNMALLRQRGAMVCLGARPETILSRVNGQEDRPLLNTENRAEEIRRLLQQRIPYYQRADLCVETDDISPKQAVNRIKRWLGAHRSEPVRIDVPRQSYEVQIGWNWLPEVGARLLGLGLGPQAAVVTNPVVGRLYGSTVRKSLQRAGFAVLEIRIPDGERFKSTPWIGRIYDQLIKKRFERRAVLVALGGGVIGDMTGFAAATYLRGIPYVQVPTTLAAQVDSSLGGKTGVNHPLGKNLIGSFHQPRLVFTDARVLKTLDRRNFVSGLAEVIKYGIIADPEFFDYLERHMNHILRLEPSHLLTAIKRSCEIKGHVVAEDEREGGRRKILNYGHTLGHAVETATGYRKYLHGEAISIGMVFAAKTALALGLCDEEAVTRQVNLLRAAGLPTDLPGRIKPLHLLKAMAHDKKVVGGKIYFVLADRIGHVQLKAIEPAMIRKVLAQPG